MSEMSPALRRACHRAGFAAAVLWWFYAFFSTQLFSGMSMVGLALYLAGLPVVYVLAYYGLQAGVWLFRELL